MTQSMTGFASAEGAAEGWRWSWDLRSVNGRGLDLRLRVPDWIEGLDAPLRAALGKVAKRGNITLSLRVSREASGSPTALDPDALARAVDMLGAAERAAEAGGVTLRQSSAAELLSLRGVFEAGPGETDTGPLRAALLADLQGLIAAFETARRAEGAALEQVITGQVDAIAAGVADAREILGARAEHMRGALAEALARVTEAAEGVSAERVAQELALIAVKADVAEELDRLDAHVAAARDLLAGPGPKGRKLDFLTQEFNREANTLCAKAQHAELSRTGLDLKHTIDQMREQVQNVE
ncbi:MAG: YicC/YloC family endoribonuclease [Pseudomonadota bacterium]